MAKDLLGDDIDKPKRAKPAPVPRPPERCSVDGCNGHADVVVLLVRRITDDKQVAGRPGAYINVKAGEWSMRKGYKFDQWVTRCGKHYGNDLERYRATR